MNIEERQNYYVEKIYSILKRNGYKDSKEKFKSNIRVIQPLWPSNFLKTKGITIDPYDKTDITELCKSFNEELQDYKNAKHNGEIINEAMFEKNNKFQFFSKELQDAKDALNKAKGEKEGAGQGFFDKLCKVVNTALSAGLFKESFTLIANIINLNFFRKFNTYFRDRLSLIVKDADRAELTKLKREANDISSRLLKARAKIKDPEKRKMIDNNLRDLKLKIKKAEEKINML